MSCAIAWFWLGPGRHETLPDPRSRIPGGTATNDESGQTPGMIDASGIEPGDPAAGSRLRSPISAPTAILQYGTLVRGGT
jgi:hypothetical protein